MKIYIPYKHKDGEELRFALRSIEKNFPDHEVVLISDKWPEWYNGLHLFHPDVSDRKQLNIISKLFKVTDESFIMWNDDHFLLKPLTEIKNWYDGTLTQALRKATGRYHQAVKNTLDHFGDIRYFDVHTPCVFTSEQIHRVFRLEWGDREFVIKSAAFNSKEGEEMTDLKINRNLSKEAIQELTKDRLFFSTGPTGFKPEMIKFLNEQFKEKSRWEK